MFVLPRLRFSMNVVGFAIGGSGLGGDYSSDCGRALAGL
jgi:glucose-6-phosphate isomerase